MDDLNAYSGAVRLNQLSVAGGFYQLTAAEFALAEGRPAVRASWRSLPCPGAGATPPGSGR